MVDRSWLQNLGESMRHLDELIVPDGPYAGKTAGEALGDKEFIEKASRWRPGPEAEGKRKIMVWAKTLKAWMGLGVGTVPPAAGAPNAGASPALRAADEPPVVVPRQPIDAMAAAGRAGPAAAAVAEVATATWWTSAVLSLGASKLMRVRLMILGGMAVIVFPRLSAAGLAAVIRTLVRALSLVLSQLAAQLSKELYVIVSEGLRAVTIAEEFILIGGKADNWADWRLASTPEAFEAEHPRQQEMPKMMPGAGQRPQPCPPCGWLPWLRAAFIGAEVPQRFGPWVCSEILAQEVEVAVAADKSDA